MANTERVLFHLQAAAKQGIAVTATEHPYFINRDDVAPNLIVAKRRLLRKRFDLQTTGLIHLEHLSEAGIEATRKDEYPPYLGHVAIHISANRPWRLTRKIRGKGQCVYVGIDVSQDGTDLEYHSTRLDSATYQHALKELGHWGLEDRNNILEDVGFVYLSLRELPGKIDDICTALSKIKNS